jgi:hypothetical protein
MFNEPLDSRHLSPNTFVGSRFTFDSLYSGSCLNAEIERAGTNISDLG